MLGVHHIDVEGPAIATYQYLLLMAACLAITAPLEFIFKVRVYRRPRRLALVLVLVAVPFIGWDIAAIARGHWTFASEYTTGWLLPGRLPIEEFVFFGVIPICALLTYEAVKALLERNNRASARRGEG